MIFSLKYLFLILVSLGLSLWLSWGWHSPLDAQQLPSPNLVEQAQELYQRGQFAPAAALLEEFWQSPTTPVEKQVSALRNLALVYQRLGEGERAQQAIATALSRLDTLPPRQRSSLLADLLDVQASLQLEQGLGEAAVLSWERASQIHQQLSAPEKAARSTINQAQALQQLGFSRRSLALLTPLLENLTAAPDSLTKSVALRSFGEALQLVGQRQRAQESLEESLAIAQRLQAGEAIADTQLSLGNFWSAQAQPATALTFYQKAADPSSKLSVTQIQARVNILALQVQAEEMAAAQASWPTILADLNALSPTHDLLFARINLARTLIDLSRSQNSPDPATIGNILAQAVASARALPDWRSESFALGTLGYLYEQAAQWEEAKNLSEQALKVGQAHNSLYLSYPWQGQLGRIYKAQNNYAQAIIAYKEAVQTLKALRADLVTVSTQAQVSFRDSIEPIYRELIALLLSPARGKVSSSDLQLALEVFESLQVAELDNFFREACLQTEPVQVDRLDSQAAVIYPIILRDRLELIVSFPGGEKRHYTSQISQKQITQITNQLRQTLLIVANKRYFTDLKTLYAAIIQPLEADLATAQVKNLIFVLDGVLRNIPMAALYDGQKFLVEKYSVSLAPSLQLLDARPLQEQNIRVFLAGLSESRQGFSPLPYVATEVQEIQSAVSSQVLLNQNFTASSFSQALSRQAAPIIHIATHGQFSSQNENTFILTWDDRLDIATLNNVLQFADLNASNPVELLVLSACETAVGDEQAALGIAGMAVRSGARSTVATLWQVDDQATALLMSRFYKVLSAGKISKTEALRQAQLEILADSRFQSHPFFWAPYVLVGNWL